MKSTTKYLSEQSGTEYIVLSYRTDKHGMCARQNWAKVLLVAKKEQLTSTLKLSHCLTKMVNAGYL